MKRPKVKVIVKKVVAINGKEHVLWKDDRSAVVNEFIKGGEINPRSRKEIENTALWQDEDR